MRNKVTLILPAVTFLFQIPSPAQISKYPNEGITYPTRSNFFTAKPVEKNSKIAFQDEKNLSNSMVFNYDFDMLSHYMSKVPGVNERSNENDPSAIKLKSSVTERAVFSNNNAINITENGFTIAFWTKWPYSSGILTSDVMRISNSDNNLDLWKVGISYDRRVFITREAGEIHATMEQPSVFWNLKFWNPEYADIDKAVTESTNGLEWFFVMVVQEKTQVRLHIGMPNGVFDCMYLNYGLEDQTSFKNAITKYLSFFGNDEELYIQDISLWDIPLCREEAFEYYKDSRGVPGGTFGLDDSAIKSTVIVDDNTRMTKEAQRTGGCMTSGNSNTVISPDLIAARSLNLIKETDDENTLNNGQDILVDKNSTKILLYPNPTHSKINIKIPSEIIENNRSPINLALIDLYGRVLRSSNLILKLNSNTIGWRIPQRESLPNGIYVLRVNVSGKIFTSMIAIDCGCN